MNDNPRYLMELKKILDYIIYTNFINYGHCNGLHFIHQFETYYQIENITKITKYPIILK